MHESEHVYRGRYSDRGVDDTGKSFPSAVHPVVRTHPVSGREALYVNRGFTTKFLDMEALESDALLNFLFTHLEQPQFQVRFQWEHEFDRVLGQPLHAAFGALGLLAGRAQWAIASRLKASGRSIE